MKIRLANRAESSLVSGFYSSNESHFVRERVTKVLLHSIEEERCLLIEGVDNDIRGICCVFGDQIREIGGIRVTLNGFGLQTKLMAVQAVSQFLIDAPLDEHPMVAITAADNLGSIKSIKRVGFLPLEDMPVSLALLSGLGLADLNPDKRYFYLPYEQKALKSAINIILEILNNPKITNPHTGEVIELDLSELPLIRSGLLEMLLNR